MTGMETEIKSDNCSSIKRILSATDFFLTNPNFVFGIKGCSAIREFGVQTFTFFVIRDPLL